MNNLGWQPVASFGFQTSCPLLECLGGTFLIPISHTCFCRETVGVITGKKKNSCEKGEALSLHLPPQKKKKKKQ